MSIKSIVTLVIDACAEQRTGLWVHEAVEMGVPMVMEDDEACGQLVREGLAARIKSRITRGRNLERSRGESQEQPQQLELWGLRPAYVLDGDGTRVVYTRQLTRVQFRGLIRVRREQLFADTAHLSILEEAESRAADLWDANPFMTFGEVFDMWQAMNRDAAE